MKQKNSIEDTEWWVGMTDKGYIAEMHRLTMLACKEIDEEFERRKRERAKEKEKTDKEQDKNI